MHLPYFLPFLILFSPTTIAADGPAPPAFDHELSNPSIIETIPFLPNDSTAADPAPPLPTETPTVESSLPTPTPTTNPSDADDDPLKIPICAAFDTLASACGFTYPNSHNIFTTDDTTWTDSHGGGECVCKNEGVISGCLTALEEYFVNNGDGAGVNIKGRVEWLQTGLERCEEIKNKEGEATTVVGDDDGGEEEETGTDGGGGGGGGGVVKTGKGATRTRVGGTVQTGGGGVNGTATEASGTRFTNGSFSTRRRTHSGTGTFTDDDEDISATDTDYDSTAIPTDATDATDNPDVHQTGVKIITITVPAASSDSTNGTTSTIGQKSEQQVADEIWQADFLTTLGIVVLLCIIAGVSCMCGIKRDHMRRDGELVNFWKEEEFPWED